MDELSGCKGFDWDAGNRNKNSLKHRVSCSDCEEVFFNLPLMIEQDELHHEQEQRYYALGITDSGRGLFVVFTIREKLIRVISAREMTPHERRAYRNA